MGSIVTMTCTMSDTPEVNISIECCQSVCRSVVYEVELHAGRGELKGRSSVGQLKEK